jgi:hypothetical protein
MARRAVKAVKVQAGQGPSWLSTPFSGRYTGLEEGLRPYKGSRDKEGAMADERVKLLKILRAELEDLVEDIGLLEKRAGERLARDEITDHVFRENDSLFRMESTSLHRLLNFIDGIDVSLYKSLDDLTDTLDLQVRDLVREHEEPQVVSTFFSRKLKKVRDYVLSAG